MTCWTNLEYSKKRIKGFLEISSVILNFVKRNYITQSANPEVCRLWDLERTICFGFGTMPWQSPGSCALYNIFNGNDFVAFNEERIGYKKGFPI